MVFYIGGDGNDGLQGNGKKSEDWTPPESSKDIVEGNPLTNEEDVFVGSDNSGKNRVPKGQPPSVWMPDYERRNFANQRYTADRGGGFVAGNINPNVNPLDNVSFNNLSKSEAISEWENPEGYLSVEVKRSIETLAKAMDYRKTGRGLWKTAIDASYAASARGIRKSPFEVLQETSNEFFNSGGSIGGDSGNGDSSGSGYSGPVTNTTFANEKDLRMMAEQLSSQLVGRGVTDDEFKKALARVRKAEANNPSVSTPGIGSSVSETGLSTEGRQDVLMKALTKNPESQDFTMATKMMGLFNNYIEGRPDA